jgi:hypothetical protein
MYNQAYDWPLRQALLTQAFFALFWSCVTDFGVASESSIIVSIPFWIWVAFVIWRNPVAPSRFTLQLIRWGLIPIILIGGHLIYPVVADLNSRVRHGNLLP